MTERASVETHEKERHESAEHEARTEKVKALRVKGLKPWASKHDVTLSCQQVLEGGEGIVGSLAGRIMTIRGHGKASFCHLQDGSGRLQLYIKEDVVGEQVYAFFKEFVDSGDLIWVSGESFITKAGELTLRVDKMELLSKCLQPLPEKFHGLVDAEIKYRQRYLDLMTSPETRLRFERRSKIISFIRNFLEQNHYLEVETPMLHPIPGGAAARPFVTHHNALDSDFYLRIAPELYLKRLIVGGFERVYEINRSFRNEGISTRHNPEFTMLEFYTAHRDYHFIMDFVTHLLREVTMDICGSLQIPYGERTINFNNIRRLSPLQAVLEFGGLSESALEPAAIDATCRKNGAKIDCATASYQQKIYALFEATAEEKIVDPVFIVDFPIETSPLARCDDNNPGIAARFELFIAGMELSNGYNELNDPFEQSDRFKGQVQERAGGNDEAMFYDADFIKALEYGMPPTVGVGIGIDRLVMLLTNTTSIREVILFPALRKKVE
ncbi:MAG: Lysine-tRNA ligase [candidate division TM6 bacterium GW2011_GWE2_42_60]|nr:MAG: Lysine-tRNA ligase [candidate division TM6 bacterium GW2011_GWE2_42_60]HBY06013.1 lysine--tRNA ligase [Candidatus Dependentiae bacterium]